jgi:hypothetical protein
MMRVLEARSAVGWWLVLVCSERRVPLAGCWWLVCSERRVLLADKPSEHDREVRSGYTRLLQSSMPLAIRRRSVRMRARRAFCWRHQRPSAQQDTEAPGARIMRGDTRCTGYGCRGGAITTCDGDVRDQLLRWL